MFIQQITVPRFCLCELQIITSYPHSFAFRSTSFCIFELNLKTICINFNTLSIAKSRILLPLGQMNQQISTEKSLFKFLRVFKVTRMTPLFLSFHFLLKLYSVWSTGSSMHLLIRSFCPGLPDHHNLKLL